MPALPFVIDVSGRWTQVKRKGSGFVVIGKLSGKMAGKVVELGKEEKGLR